MLALSVAAAGSCCLAKLRFQFSKAREAARAHDVHLGSAHQGPDITVARARSTLWDLRAPPSSAECEEARAQR